MHPPTVEWRSVAPLSALEFKGSMQHLSF